VTATSISSTGLFRPYGLVHNPQRRTSPQEASDCGSMHPCCDPDSAGLGRRPSADEKSGVRNRCQCAWQRDNDPMCKGLRPRLGGTRREQQRHTGDDLYLSMHGSTLLLRPGGRLAGALTGVYVSHGVCVGQTGCARRVSTPRSLPRAACPVSKEGSGRSALTRASEGQSSRARGATVCDSQ
jgi:hypothetical protein